MVEPDRGYKPTPTETTPRISPKNFLTSIRGRLRFSGIASRDLDAINAKATAVTLGAFAIGNLGISLYQVFVDHDYVSALKSIGVAWIAGAGAAAPLLLHYGTYPDES